MRVEKQILHHYHLRAKEELKKGNKDEARDCCDKGIAWVASKKLEGMKPEDLLEGVSIKLWLVRFWVFLENNNLILT